MVLLHDFVGAGGALADAVSPVFASSSSSGYTFSSTRRFPPGYGQSAPRCKLPPTFGVPSGNREARMSHGAHSTNHSSCQVDLRCLMMSFLSLPGQKVPRSPFPFSVIYQEVTSLGFVRAFLPPAFRTRYVRTHSKRAVHHASAATIYPNSIDEFH